MVKQLARIMMISLFLAGLVGGCGRYRVMSDVDGAPPDTLSWPDALIPPDAGLLDATPPDSKKAPDLGQDGAPSAFTITTTSPLTEATEGFAYKQQFAASGGTPPLGWLIKKGKIPAGLVLQSSGLLTGTPTQLGDFSFTLKAVDDATPPNVDQKAFTLKVKVAPLQITGGTVYNLLVIKVVVLPVVTIISGVKIPYNTQLQAKGGLKPYTWTQQKLPGLLRSLVPNSGIPTGLTLDKTGKLSGTVTTTKDVITVPGLPLKGFLFAARVADSQKKADTADGVFLLPAIP